MRKYEVGTTLFYGLLTVVAAMVVALPLCTAGRQTLVAAHHLRAHNFTTWAVLQFAPSMYNYGHQVWISEESLSASQLRGEAELPPNACTQWVNHYPTRMMTFGAQRAALIHRPRTVHFYLHSGFGPTQVDSHYCLEPRDGAVTMRLVADAGPGERSR